nr:hypothetical protein [Tanacetum cinerariifolium]
TSNSSPKVTAAHAKVVSVAKGKKGKWLNGGYVAFGGNLKGGKITGKGKIKTGNPQHALKDKGVIDSRCSRHMIGNMSYLSDFEELNGGYVAFGGNPKGEKAGEESDQRYVLFPVWSSGFTNPQNTDGDAAFDEKDPLNFSYLSCSEPEFNEKKPESEVNVSLSSSARTKKHDDKTRREAKGKSLVESFTGYRNLSAEFEDLSDNGINEVNAADITYSDEEDDVGVEADFNNLETSIIVNPILTKRVHKYHPVKQIIGDLSSATQTRSMIRKNPRGYIKLLKIQVRLKLCRKSYFNSRCRRNKKDKRGIVVRNKARFVIQGHTQEEGIDYEEIFASVARIEAIRLFLAYASFMGFMVYQMDIKSAFMYGTIEEEFYVCQPLGFEDLDHPYKIYIVVKALYGLHQAPRAWYETLANCLLENGFQRGKIDQTLFIKRQKGIVRYRQVKQKKDEIFISQDKYVAEILRKFRLKDRKAGSTPVDTKKPLLKDPNGEDVDVHIYKSMIGLLMYLTSPRPDIMFAVCAFAHF